MATAIVLHVHSCPLPWLPSNTLKIYLLSKMAGNIPAIKRNYAFTGLNEKIDNNSGEKETKTSFVKKCLFSFQTLICTINFTYIFSDDVKMLYRCVLNRTISTARFFFIAVKLQLLGLGGQLTLAVQG